MQVPMNGRMVLAALADRLIYGTETTFHRQDAVQALAMVRGARPPRFMRLSARGTTGGRSMKGVAAGVGNIGFRDESRFDLDTDKESGIRAGQWKITPVRSWVPGVERIEIEQVMAQGLEEGRTARIEYRAGEPLRMDILKLSKLSLPIFWLPKHGAAWVSISISHFVPWKQVDGSAPAEASPYEGQGPGQRDALRFLAS